MYYFLEACLKHTNLCLGFKSH
uniref:Uncharacterized protein n=1 Tax=Rhizophora mucronata TaxID=61149 RepID=A0A2P2QYN1_RHIMU